MKKPKSFDLDFFGTPWRIRTVDTKRRRLVLYPAELMVHICCDGIISHFVPDCKPFRAKKYAAANFPSLFFGKWQNNLSNCIAISCFFCYNKNKEPKGGFCNDRF